MISVREVEEKLGLSYVNHIRHRKDIQVIKTNQGIMIKKDDFKVLQKEGLFKSKSLTVKEATEISGLSKAKLLNRLKEGEERRLIGNTIYVDKEALERLIKEREPFKKFIEESITLRQAMLISGISAITLRKHLKEGQEWINFDGGCYVKKQALERLMEERNVTPTIPVTLETNEVPDGYTPIVEICQKNNLDYNAIRDRVGRDLKEHTVKVNNRIYLKNDIIPNLVDEYHYIKKSYLRTELMALLGITPQKLLYVLDELKKDVEWRQIGKFEYFDKEEIDKKIAEYGGSTQYYQICKQRRESLRTPRDYTICNKKYSLHAPDTVQINGDTFIKARSIQQLYKLTAKGTTLNREILQNAIKKGTITNTYVDKNKVLYVSKKELDSIKEVLDNSISISELKEELSKINGTLNIANQSVLYHCPDGVDVFNFNIFGLQHNRIRTPNPKQFKADFIKRAKEEVEFRNTKNPHNRYELLEKQFTEEQRTQFPFVIKTYKEFVFNKLNNTKSNSVINMTHELFMSLKRFVNISPSDVCLLTDDEILQILSSAEMAIQDRNQFSLYLNYLRRKYPDKCVFKNQYNRYKENRVRDVEDVYTLEEWGSYVHFLTDINKHIKKAFERYSYAKRWLYAILHFSVGWRSGDFLETPGFDFLDSSGNPDFDNIDIHKYTLDWFKNNDFKLSDGQIIINLVKRFVENRVTRKTGARKHFIIPRHYVIPVSIAIIINEQHRRANNSSTLFSVGKIEPKSLREYLGEEMAGFSSQKANRSLISYLYHEADNSAEYNSIAYSMGSYLRSHKPNMYQKAETTSQYIHALNKDGDINRISMQLFRRGVFGWLYKVMIELAYGKDEYGLLEMTTAIETLQKHLSANGIENISRFMTYELDSRRTVINELLKAPTDQLKGLIDKLILGNLTSKERNIYCIKPEKCPFPTQNSCKGCRYSIPTNYSLLAIGDELLVLFDKLSLVEDTDVINRQKYTFQIARLLTVLSEAKSEFDQLDPDYFKTFVPLREIRDRKNKVEHKFLIG